jgi:hypothetical protein
MRFIPEFRSYTFVYIFISSLRATFTAHAQFVNSPIDGSYPLAGFPLLLTYLWFSRDLMTLGPASMGRKNSEPWRKMRAQLTPYVEGYKRSQKICGS